MAALMGCHYIYYISYLIKGQVVYPNKYKTIRESLISEKLLIKSESDNAK